MSHASEKSGFTLIEMVIGMAIMAIVLALAAPNFGAWIQNSRIRNAAESILNGLQLARSEAVLRNASVQFNFTTGSGWQVGCQVVTATCPAVIQSRSAGEGSSAAVTVSAPDGTPIRFDNLGRMVVPVPAGGAAFTSINVDIAPTVLSAAQSRDLRITVTVGGNVRMCDPNVSEATDSRFCTVSGA